MNHDIAVQMLLCGERALGPAEGRQTRARVMWVKETVDKWREAMRQMDENCTAAVEHLDEEAFNHLFDEEQAKVDAIRAQIDDVIERDQWPKELYWTV